MAFYSRGNEPQQEVSLEMINLQDVVDPTVINNNFSTLKKFLCTDFVSDHGSYSENGAVWYYYRLNNGFTFFFVTYKFPEIVMDIRWDNYPSSASLTIPGRVPVMLSDVEYYNIVLKSHDLIAEDNTRVWRYFNISTAPSGFTNDSGGYWYPPKFCVYKDINVSFDFPFDTYYSRITNAYVSLFGFGFLN